MASREEKAPIKNAGDRNNFKVVAVTGANGFIASHLVGLLLTKGYTVRAIVRNKDDASKTAHLTKLAEESKSVDRLSFHSGDLLTEGSYDDAFKGCECIFHTAAVVLLSHKDPMKGIVQPSIDGTRNVLASADKAGTVKRLVYTSSVAAVMNFNKPDGAVFTEEDWNDWATVENGDAYGFAKMSADRMVHDHCKKAEVQYDCASINPGVVIGPVLHKAHTKTSPVIVRQCIFHNEQPDAWVYFVDVRDVVQAHVQAMELNMGVAGERFLLVGPQEDSYLQTADLGERCCAARPDIVCASPVHAWWKVMLMKWTWQLSTYQVNMLTRKNLFDNTKSQEVLGIKYTDLNTSLGDTIDSMAPWVNLKYKEGKKPEDPN